MTALLDPYFRERTVTDGEHRVTRVEVMTADEVVVTQQPSAPTTSGVLQVPPTADLEVHADVVTIHGPLHLPGRNVTIVARKVVAVAAGELGPAVILDGTVGEDPPAQEPRLTPAGKGDDALHQYHFLVEDTYRAPQVGHEGKEGNEGAQGAQGGRAGTLRIHCGTLENRASEPLLLSADGGRGGRGQQGQDGQPGGRGGAGSAAWRGGVNDEWTATPGAPGGPGGRGGPGGPGGPGGSAGSIELTLTRPAAGAVTTSVLPGAGGPGGFPGDGGPGGQGGTGGAGLYDTSPEPYRNPNFRSLPKADDGPTGTSKGTGVEGHTGRTGDEGTSTVVTDAGFGSYAQVVSVEQLTMAAERARWQYLTLSRDDATELMPRLAWIAAVGQAVSSTAGPQAAEATALATMASSLQHNLALGKDFYGHEPGWVPASSLSHYADLLGDTVSGELATLKVVEARWEQYRAAVDDATTRRSSLQQAVALADARLMRLTSDLAGNRASLEHSVTTLKQLDGELATKRRKLEEAGAQFEEAIRSSFGLTPGKVFDVLGTLAFWPAGGETFNQGAMGMSAVGQLASDTFTKTVTDSGDVVGKQYVTHQVDVLDRKLSDQLSDSWSVHNGFIESDDPDGYKLSCTRADYQRLIDDFYDSQPSARDLGHTLDDFMRTAQTRNRAVSQHNSLLAGYYQLKGQIEALRLQRDVASGDSASTHVPAHDLFVEGLYRRVLEDTIESVYLLGKAYEYWALEEYDVFTRALNVGADGVLDSGALLTAKQNVLHEFSRKVERGLARLQPRHDPLVVIVDDEGTLDDLRGSAADTGSSSDRHAVTIAVPAALPGDDHADNPFAGRANVRLAEVRCWLDGVTTTSGLLSVRVTQTGDLEEIVDQEDGSSHFFTHSPVERRFEHLVKGDGSVQVESRACFWPAHDALVAERLPTYSPIGPFATWQVVVKDSEQEGEVDWSGLSAVRLEFVVWDAPMPD